MGSAPVRRLENGVTINVSGSGVTRVKRDPKIQFGEPTAGRSRTTVVSIVLAAMEGEGVDGIRQDFPHLSAEDVADALAFYLQNRAEVDRIIEQSAGA